MQATLSQPVRLDALTRVLLLVSVVLTLVGGVLALGSPPDVNQGYVARIFHLHVPLAWISYLSVFVSLGYSIAYLVRSRMVHDRIAAAALEVGLIFQALTLLSGMLWARPTWGVYWVWEPRLTTTAVLFAICIGYFVVRSAIEDPEFRGKAAAAVAILGAINVPISYMSVNWWRSIHQTQSINLTTGKISVSSEILIPMLVNLVAFTLFYLALVRFRAYLAARTAAKELA